MKTLNQNNNEKNFDLVEKKFTIPLKYFTHVIAGITIDSQDGTDLEVIESGCKEDNGYKRYQIKYYQERWGTVEEHLAFLQQVAEKIQKLDL